MEKGAQTHFIEFHFVEMSSNGIDYYYYWKNTEYVKKQIRIFDRIRKAGVRPAICQRIFFFCAIQYGSIFFFIMASRSRYTQQTHTHVFTLRMCDYVNGNDLWFIKHCVYLICLFVCMCVCI